MKTIPGHLTHIGIPVIMSTSSGLDKRWKIRPVKHTWNFNYSGGSGRKITNLTVILVMGGVQGHLDNLMGPCLEIKSMKRSGNRYQC